MAETETEAGGLRRIIGTSGGVLLTLASLSPGVGVFIVGNDMLHQAGSGAIPCIAAATLLGLAMAAIYGELGSAFPHAGAEYTIAGRVLGPRAGFAMLAANLLGLPIGMAISGLGIADYMQAVLPAIDPRAVAVPAVLAAVFIAACSIRLNTSVTALLVAAEMLALAVVAGLGFLHAAPDALDRLPHPTMALAAGGIGPVPFGVLAVASGAGVYALNGYGGVLCFGEEIERAEHNVARVVYLALGIGAAIILLPLAGVIAGAPSLDRLYHDPSPISGFLGQTGGRTVTILVSLSVAGAIFNCMVAVALTFGRVLFAAARDEAWPAPINRIFARLSRRFGSPANATLLFAALTVPLCLVPLKVLILINGNLAIAMYGTLSLGVIAGRRNGATRHSQWRTILHPLAPLVVLAATVALAIADLLDPESGQPALLATAAIVLIGILYSEYVTRRNKQWAHRDALALVEGG